jgi:hypothetical protein
MAELLPIGQLLSIAKVGGGVIEFGNERVGYSGCIRTAAMNNGILELFLPTITQSWKYRRWALTRDLSRPIRVPGGLTVRLVSSRTSTLHGGMCDWDRSLASTTSERPKRFAWVFCLKVVWRFARVYTYDHKAVLLS